MHILNIFLILFGIVTLAVSDTEAKHKLEEVIDFLTNGQYDKIATETCYNMNVAEWNYNTNLTEYNAEVLTNVTLLSAEKEKELYNEWFKDVSLDDIKDENVRRQLKFLKDIGSAALDKSDLSTLTDIKNRMTDVYSTGKICPFDKQNCDLHTEGMNLEPEIESVLVKSRNYDELVYIWAAWRNATGKKIRQDYVGYVNLSNKVAILNGYKDNGDYWRSAYESDTFIEDVDQLWEQVEPLYSKLHSYVRKKLIDLYGIDKIGDDGLIPANVLGNMWAQTWAHLGNVMMPYPDEPRVDVTKALIDKGYTVKKMFETSDDFYTSLGLPTNKACFQNDSMLVKPEGRNVLCHASAWDFCDKKTFRIKMCTEINDEDFVTIHHEMGHIQYYLLYKDQPTIYRSGANPGFHEAVGDTIALSVSNPIHLQKIGLLDNYTDSDKDALNTLMEMALERVAFLPFGLLIDKWRWDVFAGTVNKENWNAHWWNYRNKYQKVKAPIPRSEEDFDAGAKYHVAGDSQYINYFVAHILQFQLYRGLCIAAKQYDPITKLPPLHKCDFYQSKEAGNKLHAGLALGLSKHWSVALKAMTGETKLDASAILDYFDPLIKYFDSQQ